MLSIFLLLVIRLSMYFNNDFEDNTPLQQPVIFQPRQQTLHSVQTYKTVILKS